MPLRSCPHHIACLHPSRRLTLHAVARRFGGLALEGVDHGGVSHKAVTTGDAIADLTGALERGREKVICIVRDCEEFVSG